MTGPESTGAAGSELRVFAFLDCYAVRIVAAISRSADEAVSTIVADRVSAGIAMAPGELSLLGSVVAVEGAVVVDSNVEDLAFACSLPMPEDGGAA